MSLRRVADAVLSALLAPPCAVCGAVIDRPLDGAVCGACWSALVPRPAAFAATRLTRAQALGPYEGVLRDIIHALKYDGRRSVAPPLAALMAAHGQHVLAGADLVVPVPLHPARRRERGFNQAEDLARGLGLPIGRLLRRIEATRAQVDLPADRRRDNVRGAFAVRHQHWPWRVASAGLAHAQIVVLIDDVATTGATLDACARVLYGAGANQVRALTAARVVRGPR